MTGTEHPRVVAMREFCERHDFDINVWRGNQRDPGDGIAIDVGGVRLRVESNDSLLTAVARMELALERLGRGGRDVYLHGNRPTDWGRPG